MPRVIIMGVIKYLVLKKLSGKEHYLYALYEYLMNNASPKEVETKYQISRNHIRSIKQRIREKHSTHGEEIARRAIPIILRIPMPQLTIVINGEISFFCRVCGKEHNTIYPEDHIAKKHREILKNYVRIVIEEIKSKRVIQ
jgi:hypothetical protein